MAANSKMIPVIAVIGYTGGVGTCLLKAMDKIGLKPFCLVRSSTMTFVGSSSSAGDDAVEVPIDLDLLKSKLLSETSTDPSALSAKRIPIIADVTASSSIQQHYEDWLASGISVVAANKGIFAGPEQKYKALLDASFSGNGNVGKLFHETTVGAGLPILSTIRSLTASSHSIKTIEGVLSGTLAYVLGQVAGGQQTLSQAVKQAKDLGYTEPDPRDDLNGSTFNASAHLPCCIDLGSLLNYR